MPATQESVRGKMPCDCTWLLVRVRTRVSWVIAMFIFGTAGVFINWLNCMDLGSEEAQRGIIIGPAPPILWIVLLVFTTIGTIFYVLEMLNTISVFFGEGRTRFPIVWEQIIVLPFEHIPLAGLNYFISRCRYKYVTTIQTLCSTISIVFVFVRLVWYAHIEGKQLQSKAEVKIKKVLFMSCCALYSCVMAFPVLNWRSSEQMTLMTGTKDVSIFLINAPFLEQGHVVRYNLDRVLQTQGRNLQNPQLVQSVWDIVAEKESGLVSYYYCDKNATFVPKECLGDGKLMFKFIYADPGEAGPYGEILYKYAYIPPGGKSGSMTQKGNGTCIEATADLSSTWRLFYFSTIFKSHNGRLHVEVTSPWLLTCAQPRPWFDPFIKVCES